jgi:citrate synthase
MTTYPTSIGTSTLESISLLGNDLADDLLGQISFGELSLWLITGTRPTSEQTRVFETVLVALADHGFTPTAISARMTYYSAPDSLQGAIAAGLLGGGSRFLGVTENTNAFLHEALESFGCDLPESDEGWNEIAQEVVAGAKAAGRKVPGLGHPVHKQRDPRTLVLIQIAKKNGVAGSQLSLFEAIGRVHADILGKTLPLNGAGAAGAVLGDLGVRAELARGVALLARTAGLLGHLAEEQVRPVAPAIYAEVDRNAEYVPLET